MKNIQIIIVFLLVGLVFNSCDDYLTKTIEFEDIGYEPQMVLNAKINDSLDVLDISISKNFKYGQTGNIDYQFIDSAKVTLSIDGNVLEAVEDLDAVETEDYYNHKVDLSSIGSIIGKQLELKASHPSYNDISSSIFLAEQPTLSDIVYEKEFRTITEFGFPQEEDRITFDIMDNSTETNYYKIQLLYDIYPAATKTDNPNAISLGDVAVLISDESFENAKTRIEIFTNTIEIENTKLFLSVSNISKSEFLFQKSFDDYKRAENFGIFAEPVTLYTNVNEGLGLFSAEQNQRVEIEQ